MNESVLKNKQDVVRTISDKMSSNAMVIIAEYRGLTVAEVSELRRNLAKDGAEMTVYKNTMVARAANELNHDGLKEYLEGPNAIIFSNDVIKGPKTVAQFARRHTKLIIKGGLAEGRVVNKDDIISLSRLPGREGLLSMLCSVLQAPIRNFAYAVKSIAEKE